TGDEARLKHELTGPRSIASLKPTLPKKLAPRFLIAAGQGFERVGLFDAAESALSNVDDPDVKDEALGLKAQLYERRKQFAKAYDCTSRLLQSSDDSEEKTIWLEKSYSLAVEGKLWTKAQELMQTAEKMGRSGKDLAPFHFLTGRNFEAKK